jgi:nucleoside-diphosphate-sugar epimerase
VVDLLSPGAKRLTMSLVGSHDRVLVLGAGGWFGRTALDLVSGTGARVHAIASSARMLHVGGIERPTAVWNEEDVRAFSPTIVIDCAFLTHDRVKDLPLETFVAINRGLIENLTYAARLPTTRTVITISSGAGVYQGDALASPLEANPYGYLKRESEERLREAVDGSAAAAVVARAWSVSGAYPRDPRAYALGDMIAQAQEGSIRINARSEVWRRYSTADELIALSLAVGSAGVTTIDSGGPLVEMSDLAEAVRAAINPAASISRGPVAGTANRYHSDGTDWARACARHGLVTLPLADQILLTARGMADPTI